MSMQRKPDQDIANRNRSQLDRQKARYANAVQRREEIEAQTPLPSQSAGYDDSGRLTTKRSGHNAIPAKGVDTNGGIADGQPVVMRGDRADAMPRVRQSGLVVTETPQPKLRWAVGYTPFRLSPTFNPEGVKVFVNDTELVESNFFDDTAGTGLPFRGGKITAWEDVDGQLTYSVQFENYIEGSHGVLYLYLISANNTPVDYSVAIDITDRYTGQAYEIPTGFGFHVYAYVCNVGKLFGNLFIANPGSEDTINLETGTNIIEFTDTIDTSKANESTIDPEFSAFAVISSDINGFKIFNGSITATIIQTN